MQLFSSLQGLGMAFTLILFNTAKNPARTAPEVEKKKDGNEKPKETKPAEKAAEKPAAKPAEEPKKTWVSTKTFCWESNN